MSNLILNSLEIEGYRAYRHLLIPQLGRVNLIVGKNNVGKSSLIEALWLYAKRANLSELKGILSSRDELSLSTLNRPTDRQGDRVKDVKNIFHGREDIDGGLSEIKIGPVGLPESLLSVTVRWYIRQRNEEGVLNKLVRVENLAANADAEAYLETRLGAALAFRTRIANWNESFLGRMSTPDQLPGHFIPANGMNSATVTRLWDGIALTEWEESVVEALQIIAPEVSRVSFVGQDDNERRRVPLVKIQSQRDPIYLRSLGEGMNRLLGIALALANSANGMLLIDEIESGLHYSIQPNVWRLIFQTARTLNVQVFATTHSWDCIEAFQQASAEDQNEEAMLIRLENKQGEIVPTLFDERRLSIATREQIEVR